MMNLMLVYGNYVNYLKSHDMANARNHVDLGLAYGLSHPVPLIVFHYSRKQLMWMTIVLGVSLNKMALCFPVVDWAVTRFLESR